MNLTNFFIALGICLCGLLLVLAYLFYKDARHKQAEVKRVAEEWRQERRAVGYWNGIERRTKPERDIAFSTDERAAAAFVRAMNADLTKSVNDVDPIVIDLDVDDLPSYAQYDYPNFDGFPFDGKSFANFREAMAKHGFVVRFVLPSKEIQVNYENPNATGNVLRVVYSAPKTIFPANLLHDDGCIRTSLWAMRKFKSEERLPELNDYAYL